MTDPDPTADDPEFEAMVRELDAWFAGLDIDAMDQELEDLRRWLEGDQP